MTICGWYTGASQLLWQRHHIRCRTDTTLRHAVDSRLSHFRHQPSDIPAVPER